MFFKTKNKFAFINILYRNTYLNCNQFEHKQNTNPIRLRQPKFAVIIYWCVPSDNQTNKNVQNKTRKTFWQSKVFVSDASHERRLQQLQRVDNNKIQVRSEFRGAVGGPLIFGAAESAGGKYRRIPYWGRNNSAHLRNCLKIYIFKLPMQL